MNNCYSESEPHILNQEAVDMQNRNHIAPLTKLPEGLTQLIQGISHAHQVELLPTASSIASFSAAGT